MLFLTDVASSTATATRTVTETGTVTNPIQEIIGGSSTINWSEVWTTILNWLSTTGIKLLIGLIVLIIAFKVISFSTKRIYKKMQKKKVDETISRVIRDVSRVFLKVLVVVCFVGYVGIETASISAVIASLGVGISLAVQGTLSNFAGGVILVIMRPFKIGDYISNGSYSGTVEDIKLFYTHLVTPDNKMVYVPNGSLANNVIVNNSTKETRRVDITMSVSYNTNVEIAKNLIKKVCAANPLILKDPDVFVDVSEYADSSIEIVTKAWCKNADYWTINFYLLNEIKKEFDENNIQIPYNHLDVNIVPNTENK